MAYPSQPVTLTAAFLTGPGGPLVDVDALTVTITDPAGAVEVATTTDGIEHVGPGAYHYTWTVPLGAPVGDHLISWSGNAGAVTAAELIPVTAASTGTWCTADEVFALTTATVTDLQLGQASAIIDLHLGRSHVELVAGRSTDEARIGRRDRDWVRRACAYQAAWLRAQPDLFARLDLTAADRGGETVEFKDRALTLAPLARRALLRVSWLRSRSLHARAATGGLALAEAEAS